MGILFFIGKSIRVLDDGVFCNDAEVCDPVLDCQPGTPVVIDDGVACTDDSCDEAANDPCTAEVCDSVAGCSNDPIPGCAPAVPSGGPGGFVLLALLLLATAARELARSRRPA